MISAQALITVQFYDLDPMNIVWHGNYPRYLETARCALLDRIGYNYGEMAENGYVWPIVEMTLKYVRPIQFAQENRVEATLIEFENRLRITYRITNQSGQTLTKAQTTQVAVNAATQELCFVTPALFQDKVRGLMG